MQNKAIHFKRIKLRPLSWGVVAQRDDAPDNAQLEIDEHHHRIESKIVVDEDTTSSSLFVIGVPKKHQKDLTVREVRQVEELQTFLPLVAK